MWKVWIVLTVLFSSTKQAIFYDGEPILSCDGTKYMTRNCILCQVPDRCGGNDAADCQLQGKTCVRKDMKPKGVEKDMKPEGAVKDIKLKGVGKDIEQKDVGKNIKQKGVEKDIKQRVVGKDIKQKGVGKDIKQKGVGKDIKQRVVGKDIKQKGIGKDIKPKGVWKELISKVVGKNKKPKGGGKDKNVKGVGKYKKPKGVRKEMKPKVGIPDRQGGGVPVGQPAGVSARNDGHHENMQMGEGWGLKDSTVTGTAPSISASAAFQCCALCKTMGKDTGMYSYNKVMKKCYCRKIKPGIIPQTIARKNAFSGHCPETGQTKSESSNDSNLNHITVEGDLEKLFSCIPGTPFAKKLKDASKKCFRGANRVQYKNKECPDYDDMMDEITEWYTDDGCMLYRIGWMEMGIWNVDTIKEDFNLLDPKFVKELNPQGWVDCMDHGMEWMETNCVMRREKVDVKKLMRIGRVIAEYNCLVLMFTQACDKIG